MNNLSNRPLAHKPTWRDFALMLVMVIVLLAVLRLQGERYHANPLTLDEAWNIYATNYSILSADVHAPLYPLLLKIWQAVAGDSAFSVRWLSSLLSLLTIAIVYHLAADLFDARAGLFAALVMASWSYFIYYGAVARPFALLAFLSALTILVFVRWMRQPKPSKKWFAAFVLCGLALNHTHFLSPYLLMGIAVCGLFFIHKPRHLIRLGFATFLTFILSFGQLFFRIGSFLTNDSWYNPVILWGPALSSDTLLDIVLPLGNYAFFFIFLSVVMLIIMLLKRITIPHKTIFQPSIIWAITLIAAALACMLLSRYGLVNQSESSYCFFRCLRRPTQPIDFALIVPMVSITLAYGISRLPTMFGGALLLIYVVSGVKLLPNTLEQTPPYREVVDYLQTNITPDEPILVDLGPTVRDYVLFEYYYITAGLVPENLYFAPIFVNVLPFRIFPFRYGELYYNNPEVFRQVIADVTEHTPRFTVVTWFESDFSRDLMEILGDRYDEVRRTEYGPIHIYEYFEQFTPTDADVLFTFDETFVLARADFPTTVAACSRLDVTTWWTLQGSPTDNYSMGLYLQDAGGVTQAQADGSPAGIETLSWEADRVYPDQRSLTVPCAPGRYDIRVTLYEPFSVTNLPVTDADGQDIGSVAALGSIEAIP